MKFWEHCHSPKSVSEARELLKEYNGEARVIGSGTDLLVDITKVEGLNTIAVADGYAVIGAGVTHTQITKSLVLVNQVTCLVEDCGLVGGPQVRNVGAIGGNVAHALSAGDGTTSLVALDADVEIFQAGVQKRVNILEMCKGLGMYRGQNSNLRPLAALSRADESTACYSVYCVHK